MWWSHWSTTMENELDVIITPKIQIKELRPREIKSSALGHRVVQWQSPWCFWRQLEWWWKLGLGVCPGTIRRRGWEPLPGPSLRLSLPVGVGLGGGCRAGGGGSGGRQQGDSHTSLFCKLFLTACLFRVRAGAAPYGSVTHCLMWQLISRACCCLSVSLLSLIGEPSGALASRERGASPPAPLALAPLAPQGGHPLPVGTAVSQTRFKSQLSLAV